jgi:predicted MFS family arabinose efflux permease
MTNLSEIRRVLAHRDFRLLWLATSASVIGDNIVLVALALFVIERTGSATDLGLVLAAQVLPFVAFLLIGGVWADRLPRHRVMVATDLVRFALHALLATLIFAGTVAIWQLVVIEMLFRSAEAFFRPAANGLLPQTVPEADIQQATAATTMSNNLAEFMGPALATVLVLGAGAGWAFALDAATFLVSAALLVRIHPRARAPAPAPAPAPAQDPASAQDRASAQAPAREEGVEPRPGTWRGAVPAPEEGVQHHGGPSSVWHEIREGAREVRSRVWVWATLASFSVALFCGLAPWFVLGPVVARERYGHIGVYGLAEASVGVGTLIGSLVAVGWRPRYAMRLGMLTTMLWPLAALLFALGVTLVVVVPATVLGGAGWALFEVWWLTALAERIPPQALSRVTSYDWMVSFALLPLGYVLAGPLAASLGAANVLGAGAVLAVAAFALGLVPRQTRMLERLERRGGRAPVEEAPAQPARRS